MPYKSRAQRLLHSKSYGPAWFERNRTKRVAAVRARRKALRDWVGSIKRKLKCWKCGEDFPHALDFDHTDPSSKEDLISELILDGAGPSKLIVEIAKCTVLCATCHRKKTFADAYKDHKAYKDGLNNVKPSPPSGSEVDIHAQKAIAPPAHKRKGPKRKAHTSRNPVWRKD